uniref:Ig-like domain-containing protein n=1 Tax=Terrapene triunguis TaxID=2587831 RepID=A0A674J9G4_9SAUR
RATPPTAFVQSPGYFQSVSHPPMPAIPATLPCQHSQTTVRTVSVRHITLPCAFTYPREIEPLRDVRVYWRRGGFHGEFIYNYPEGFTHPDYGGRIVLVGDPQGNRTASIRIDRLRESDASEYICHVRVQKNDGTWEQWCRHVGTHLTVTGDEPWGAPGYHRAGGGERERELLPGTDSPDLEARGGQEAPSLTDSTWHPERVTT